MGKYGAVFRITLQDSLQYRVDFFAGWLVNLWTLLAPLAFWAAVFRESPGDLAYGFDTLAAYLVAVHLLYRVILANDLQFEVGRDIREGRLNQFLGRPLSYPVFGFVSLLARRCTKLLALVLPLSTLVLALHFLGFELGLNLAVFCIAACLGMVLSFLLYFLFGLLAFWILECQALFVTLGTALFFLAGGLFPLDIVAGGRYLMVLPFSWQLMFPVRVLLGMATVGEIWQGLGIQVFWILLAAGINLAVWRAGLKRYEAVGG